MPVPESRSSSMDELKAACEARLDHAKQTTETGYEIKRTPFGGIERLRTPTGVELIRFATGMLIAKVVEYDTEDPETRKPKERIVVEFLQAGPSIRKEDLSDQSYSDEIIPTSNHEKIAAQIKPYITE